MFKKMLGLAALSSLLLFACKKTDRVLTDSEQLAELSQAGRQCASFEVLQQQLKEDPSLQKRMDEIEAFTNRILQSSDLNTVLSDGTLELPVHVNVIYRTSGENVSNAQIQSQIDVLNEDFGATNADYNTPNVYQSVRSGDIKIRFVWTTSKVTRRATNKVSWQTNNDMKRTAKGGIDPTSPSNTLNIWVCNLANSILGYAQFPGGSSSTDGVVIDNNAFGRGSYSLFTNFNKGRTATHEVGHYFGLRHIWGDATCGNDQVNDTPPHNTANYGCPASNHTSTCSGTPVEMTMNYMDYTDDRCMYMFTQLQKSRMQTTYAVGGSRSGLRQ